MLTGAIVASMLTATTDPMLTPLIAPVEPAVDRFLREGSAREADVGVDGDAVGGGWDRGVEEVRY